MPHSERDTKPQLDIDARVDEALEESFPASDPPPWTLGAPRWSKSAPPDVAPPGSARARRDPELAALQGSVAEIMNDDVRWVPWDMPLERAAQELTASRSSGAAVCAADGTVVGVLSTTDLTSFYGGAHEGRLVRDVMTRDILAVRPDEPVERAIRLMASERVHRLLVIDRRGQLVGVVTSMDVLRELADLPRGGPRAPRPIDGASVRRAH